MAENQETTDPKDEAATAGNQKPVIPAEPPRLNQKPSLQEVIGNIPLQSQGAEPQAKSLEVLPLKKEYPKPVELKPEAPKDDTLGAKVTLKDIPLPEYMKGAVPVRPNQPPQTEEATHDGLAFYEEHQAHIETPVERSMREIGARIPTGPNALNIVAVNTEHRTEIDENGIPRIRTYAADMSAEIKKRGASLATIAGAEREREVEKAKKEKSTDSVKRQRVALVLLLSTGVLVVLGGIIIAAAVFLSSQEETAVERANLIPVNHRSVIELGTNASLSKILAVERAEADLTLGEVTEFVITRDGRELTGQEIMLILGAPEVLARNVTRTFVGLHAFDRNQPFIIAEVSTYDLAFDAILLWENRMAETLGDFFAPVKRTPVPPPLTFTDRVFRNLDLRESGTAWPIIYTFPERNVLILTTNESTLKEALTRLAISKTRSI